MVKMLLKILKIKSLILSNLELYLLILIILMLRLFSKILYDSLVAVRLARDSHRIVVTRATAVIWVLVMTSWS